MFGLLSVPSFLAGLLLIMVFVNNLGWFPRSQWVRISDSVSGNLYHAILPAIVDRPERDCVVHAHPAQRPRRHAAGGLRAGRARQGHVAVADHGGRRAASVVVLAGHAPGHQHRSPDRQHRDRGVPLRAARHGLAHRLGRPDGQLPDRAGRSARHCPHLRARQQLRGPLLRSSSTPGPAVFMPDVQPPARHLPEPHPAWPPSAAVSHRPGRRPRSLAPVSPRCRAPRPRSAIVAGWCSS